MWSTIKSSWMSGFAVLVAVLCLATAIAYSIRPYDSDPRAVAQSSIPGAAPEQAPGSAAVDTANARLGDQRIAYKVLLLSAMGAAAVWFAYAFTGDPVTRRHEQVKFAYFFVLGSFALLMIPPFVKSQAIGSEPIGIVSGCVPEADAIQLRCSPRESGAAADKVDGPVVPGKAAREGASARPALGTSPQNNQWLVNIGGALREQGPCIRREFDDCKPGSSDNRVDITGGLVVPLPFVIIALFGGAISLSRRVPEIQKRSEVGYLATPAEPAMDMREAREALVFQIMQFASAPLIAIAAHQIIEPESQSSAVGLAFLAGFGSETILLMIRGIANGIQPKSAMLLASGTAGAGGAPDSGGGNTVGRDSMLPGAGTQTPLRLTHGVEGDGATDPVYVRLCVDDEGIEAGSLSLNVDGRPAAFSSDGCAELELASGRPYRIEARARRAGQDVRGELALTADADDDGKPVMLALV